MNHNEERHHIDPIIDNTDHLNPIIVYPSETGTQVQSGKKSTREEHYDEKMAS